MTSAWEQNIEIPLTLREMKVVARYAMEMASCRHPLLEGVSFWKNYDNVLREAADIVSFQVDDYDEEQQLKAQGADVRKGMAFLSPQSALAMMQSMAADQSAFKDVPTVTSIIRKIAARLGQRMPKIAPPGKQGNVSDPTQADFKSSQVPGATAARTTDAPTASVPGYEDQAAMQRSYQNIPYLKDPQAHQANLGPAVPDLQRDPDQLNQFIAPKPERAKAVRQQDVDSMKGSGRASARVQDPSQQERTQDMEDPEKWFREARRLLNRSPWGLLESFGAGGVGGEADGFQEDDENV